jgi:hypothetical protein
MVLFLFPLFFILFFAALAFKTARLFPIPLFELEETLQLFLFVF